jgi:hypothetical protein
MLNSVRRGIQYPNPDFSDRPNIPAHLKFLVDALEIDLVYAQGASATRIGRSHLEGVFFYETDTGLSWYDDGAVWHKAGGTGVELDFAQLTTSLSAISATSEGTAVAVIVGNSVTYDGTRNKIEFFIPGASPSAALSGNFVLLRDTTVLGQCPVSFSSTTDKKSFKVELFDTPSAAAHVYKASLFVGTGNVIINAGVGGTGAQIPGFLRVTRA